MSITIDNEFRTLIPPLTAEEFSQLEANCLENGIQDSLKTWNGVLVDGHNRHEIAEKHGLEYKTEEMEFSSRDDVKLWIIKNQLGRRNLDKWQRFDLAKQQEHIEKARAKKVQMSNLVQNKHTEPENLPPRKQGDTRDIMGERVGVSGKTYDKMKAIDESDNEEIKKAVRNKEVSIDRAYREVKGLPPKKNPSPHLEVTDADAIVTNPEVMKNPHHIEERSIELAWASDDGEEVEDVAKDATETAGLAYADDILSGITKIVNTVKYNRANVVDEISKLECEGFSRDEFKASVEECMLVLARLKNALGGLVIREY